MTSPDPGAQSGTDPNAQSGDAGTGQGTPGTDPNLVRDRNSRTLTRQCRAQSSTR